MDPYCQINTDAGLDGNYIVPEGSYTITHSQQRKDWTAMEGVEYAGGANTDRTLSTAMTLSSTEHTAVKQMICSRWGSPNAAGWLTINDMKETLDGIAQLNIAQ